MDIVPWDVVLAGLGDAFTLHTLSFVVLGVAIGIVVGAIPGLNSLMAIAIAIPLTFYMDSLTAIAFLVGVSKGGTYGGSIAAVLLNTPGSPEAAATAFDGYPLAQQGKPQKALKAALYGSVFGDTFSDVVLILVAAPLATVALLMGPAELTAMLIFALTLISGLIGQSLFKGLIAVSLGVIVSSVGLDPETAAPRMTFGIVELQDGVPLVVMAIGLLALAEVFIQMENRAPTGADTSSMFRRKTPRADRVVTAAELVYCLRTFVRSSVIGTIGGALPGIGASVLPFVSYGAAQRASKNPETFGKGNIEGIIASEAANSATVGANLIPLLTLGIPGTTTAALLVGAFLIHGILPGPTMFENHGRLIYGLFGAMMVANLVNLVLGQFGLRILAMVLLVPKRIVFPVVIVFCIAGAYLSEGSMFAVLLIVAFGFVGYFMRKLAFPYVTFIIGFILGPLLENSMNQMLVMSGDDPLILVTRPISLALVLLSLASIVYFVRGARNRRAPIDTPPRRPDDAGGRTGGHDHGPK